MITKSKRIIDLTSIELTNALLVEFQEALQKSEERLLKLIKGNEGKRQNQTARFCQYKRPQSYLM